MSADARAAVSEVDRALVRRMAERDEAALGELYDRWVTLVHSLAVRIVRDANDAAEVVEETFWQAWRTADRYDASRGAVSTWLTTIARSRALDRVRARRRSPEEPLSTVVPSDIERADVPGRGDPFADAEATERRERVRRALAGLPDAQREAVELAYFGGLSQTEIAERTGQPLGTVKTRVRLAMEKLRDTLSVLRDDVRGGTT